MDNEFKLNINNKHFVKYLKLILIGILMMIEILIGMQYAERYVSGGTELELALMIISCTLLFVVVVIDSFIITRIWVRFIIFGAECLFLLSICAITANSYLYFLYCVVLTQFYISINDIKTNAILFGVSLGLYIVSFICSWVVVNRGASFFKSFVQILGDIVFGVSVITVHAAVTNFILKFYANNLHLRQALKEADESKAQLKDVYEQLSHTAVFEERNRIAKDIHDNAGHSLTTVIMQTEAAKLLIDSNPEEAKNRIISANIQAKNALDQMRESVHLFAGRANARTLKEEIEEVIAQTIDGTELKIRYDIDDVSVGVESFRFIINSTKESIANGLRHGKATAFYIELKKSLSGVSLLISDNGAGIDGDVKEGFGLKGMREKAEALGGKCDFSSEKGEGFEVEITLPLDK
ncbi:MAG: sensor histidine kinase [Clostridia bacterium]|nr:sensor histidine kinase [Clostridia bacterium]